jgi:hypothetical protein
MAQQQISTNTFGCAKWIVSADATQGTHTTIAAAITSASSGDTIFIRPGTYTENLTHKAGINIAAFEGDDERPNVTIVGLNTYTGVGRVSISNIRLQTNGDYILSVTGNSASLVSLVSCVLIMTDHTGFNLSSTSADSNINLENCFGDVGVNGITLYEHTGKGGITIEYSKITSSGISTTISESLDGTVYIFYSLVAVGLKTTAGTIGIFHCTIYPTTANVYAMQFSGAAFGAIVSSTFQSGTSAAIAVGAGSEVKCYTTYLNSQAAIPVTGSGTYYHGGNISPVAVTLDPLLTQYYSTLTGIDLIYTTNKEFSINTGTGAINVGTDAAAKTLTLGNATGATSVVVNCGTGALNLGTNAIARTTTLGNTTGASVLALKYGTGDMTLASATGTVISALDTGEVTMPLQSAFSAFSSDFQANVTGDGTNYTVLFDTEIFDKNGDYANATSIFTAPVTAKYLLTTNVRFSGVINTMTVGSLAIVTTARTYSGCSSNPYAIVSTDGYVSYALTQICDMTAGDTAYIVLRIDGGTKTVDVYGNATAIFTSFEGSLFN